MLLTLSEKGATINIIIRSLHRCETNMLNVTTDPCKQSNKLWTPRKWLIVMASGLINRDELLQAGRHGIQAYNRAANRHAYECVEATIADWAQRGICQNARDYFYKSSDKAIHRLIRDVLKEARATCKLNLMRGTS